MHRKFQISYFWVHDLQFNTDEKKDMFAFSIGLRGEEKAIRDNVNLINHCVTLKQTEKWVFALFWRANFILADRHT